MFLHFELYGCLEQATLGGDLPHRAVACEEERDGGRPVEDALLPADEERGWAALVEHGARHLGETERVVAAALGLRDDARRDDVRRRRDERADRAAERAERGRGRARVVVILLYTSTSPRDTTT